MKSYFLLFALFALFGVLTSAEKLLRNQDPIFLDEAYHTGFLPVGNDSSIFYWLFESRSQPSKDPLVISLSGGPGWANELTIFGETGPYRVNSDGKTLRRNPYSWNNIANVLYPDQPYGVGYSQTGNPEGTGENELASKQFYAFLVQFFRTHPCYSDRKFYITSESFVFSAIFGAYLLNTPLSGRLGGIIVGSGLANPITQFPSVPDFLRQNGRLDKAGYDKAVQEFKKCKTDILAQGKSDCFWALWNATGWKPVGEYGNIFDLRTDCPDAFQTCYDFTLVDSFVNQSSYQAKIGVQNITWSETSSSVNGGYQNAFTVSHINEVAAVLKAGKRVLSYNGDQDIICNWVSGEGWTELLDWSGSKGYKKTKRQSFGKYGEYRSYKNLTWVKVYNAGHKIAYDQPEASLALLKRFLKGW